MNEPIVPVQSSWMQGGPVGPHSAALTAVKRLCLRCRDNSSGEKNKTLSVFLCCRSFRNTFSDHMSRSAVRGFIGYKWANEFNDMMVVYRSWVWARSGREATSLGRWVEVRRWDGWRRRCRNTRRRRSSSSCLWTGKHCVCVCVSYTYRFHQLSPDFCLFTALLLFFILSVSVFAAFVVSLLFLSDLLWHTWGQSFSHKNEGYEFLYCSISR